jgi:hypothetical protein
MRPQKLRPCPRFSVLWFWQEALVVKNVGDACPPDRNAETPKRIANLRVNPSDVFPGDPQRENSDLARLPWSPWSARL